jgi:hypothetical protein
MHPQPLLDEYLLELRARVCSRCIERPEGGPPCGPLGKQCGIELRLSEFVDAVHAVNNARIDPYIDSFHERVCEDCQSSTSSQCPCPLKYLLLLAVEAIETVDDRHKYKISDNAS